MTPDQLAHLRTMRIAVTLEEQVIMLSGELATAKARIAELEADPEKAE